MPKNLKHAYVTMTEDLINSKINRMRTDTFILFNMNSPYILINPPMSKFPTYTYGFKKKEDLT